MLWKLKLLNLWIIISKWCAISTSIHFSLNKKCLAGKEIKINDVVNPHPEVVVYLKPAARKSLGQNQRTKFYVTVLKISLSDIFWVLATPSTTNREVPLSEQHTQVSLHFCRLRLFYSYRELRVLICHGFWGLAEDSQNSIGTKTACGLLGIPDETTCWTKPS